LTALILIKQTRHDMQPLGLDAKEGARWKAAVQPIVNDYIKELDRKKFKG
jgi:hypothetical protein